MGASTPSAYFTYTEPGVYYVNLQTTNLWGCTSNTSQSITVSDSLLSSISAIEDNGVRIWSAENEVYIDFSALQDVNADITIFNTLGQRIDEVSGYNNRFFHKEVTSIKTDYLLVSVLNKGKLFSKKVFIQ